MFRLRTLIALSVLFVLVSCANTNVSSVDYYTIDTYVVDGVVVSVTNFDNGNTNCRLTFVGVDDKLYVKAQDPINACDKDSLERINYSLWHTDENGTHTRFSVSGVLPFDANEVRRDMFTTHRVFDVRQAGFSLPDAHVTFLPIQSGRQLP